MRVGVVGLWHLGSVTAACVAERFETLAFDPDSHVLDELEHGRPPISEPGLADLWRSGLDSGRLRVVRAREDLRTCDVTWITFDTPVDDDDVADVPYVENQVRQVMPYLRDGSAVLVSSQMPVGSTRALAHTFAAQFPDRHVTFAYSPENLRLGKALQVFRSPDRIVLGATDEKADAALLHLLGAFGPVERMGLESAEMTKHAINSFLALSVTFANEIAGICEHVGADAKEVERGLKTESRIGMGAYVGPGTAFAGGTLARDQAFLASIADRAAQPAVLLRAIRESNDSHKHWIENRLRARLGSLSGARVGLLGLTYKPGTDTLRRSEAVALARLLAIAGCEVRAFDPAVKSVTDDLPVSLVASPEEVFVDADAVVVCTPWPAFRELNPSFVDVMKEKTIVDPLRVLPHSFRGNGVWYAAVGLVTAGGA